MQIRPTPPTRHARRRSLLWGWLALSTLSKTAASMARTRGIRRVALRFTQHSSKWLDCVFPHFLSSFSFFPFFFTPVATDYCVSILSFSLFLSLSAPLASSARVIVFTSQQLPVAPHPVVEQRSIWTSYRPLDAAIRAPFCH